MRTPEFDDGIEDVGARFSGDMSAANVRSALHGATRDTLENRIAGFERCARQILLDAGHDPNRPGYFEVPAEHFGIAAAHEILRRISIFRGAVADGNQPEAFWQVIKIEELATTYDFFVEYEPIIRRGRAFVKGPKNRRSDALGRAITRAFSQLGLDASAKTLVQFLVKVDKIEIEGGKVWISNKGREKKIILKSLHNRIAKIRGQLTGKQYS
jgi:hypothetical protein